MNQDERLEETERAIRDRLRHVCSHLGENDFSELVRKIAINELKASSFGWNNRAP